MRTLTVSLTTFLSLTTAVACGDDGDTLRERMTKSPSFQLRPTATYVSMNVRYWEGENWRSSRVELATTGGDVTLSADDAGQISLDKANLELANVDLGEAAALTLPNDLVLTNVSLRTTERHECNAVDWSPDEDACSANVPASLIFSYQLMGRDPRSTPTSMPIATNVGVSLTRKGATLSVSLDASAPGTLGWWDGILEFRDLTLRTTGTTTEPQETFR